jgi:hypothetical protein
MSDKRTAFINADGVVVQVIVGSLTEDQRRAFLRDYSIIFNATDSVLVDDGEMVWIGGTYNPDEGFAPPPLSPEPEIIEGTSEEIIPVSEEPAI